MTDATRTAAGQGEALDELVNEIMERLEAGEAVDLDAYAREHPERVERVRQLLPTLEVLAELGRSGASAAAGPGTGSESRLAGTLGDFRLIREVGRGGMGIVYEAEQISLRRRVALKVLPWAGALDPKRLQRFKNEALAAASLKHEHIVQVYAVGCERGVHFYAMEFVEGQTLAQLIHALQPGPEKSPTDATQDYRAADDAPTATVAALSTMHSGPRGREFYRRAAALIADAAAALEHAHSLGVVHRDIKPANLLLDGDGRVYVSDFGLARFGSDADLTMSGDLLGTLRYMAPEQALARHGLVDHRADVYALGATLYELLSLRPAVAATERAEVLRQIAFEETKPPRKLEKNIPTELETIALKCLAKNPAERYATAGEMAEDLRRWLEDKAIKAKPPTPVQRARKWARRHRPAVRAAAAALVVVLAALAGTAGWWVGDRAVQIAETERALHVFLAEADRFQQERRLPEALDQATLAAALLAGGKASWRLEQQVRDRLSDLQFAAGLEAVAMMDNDGGDVDRDPQADRKYAELFQAAGLDVDVLAPEDAARRMRNRTVPVELAAALDDWAMARRHAQEIAKWAARDPERIVDNGRWQRLLALARAVDPDPTRGEFRSALEKGDMARVRALLASAGTADVPLATVAICRLAAVPAGGPNEIRALLQRAQERFPADFWVNYSLAWAYGQGTPVDFEKAVHYYRVAIALRPHMATCYDRLADVLFRTGRLGQAVAMQKQAVQRKPEYPWLHISLGNYLWKNSQRLDAVAAYREAIRLKPDLVAARNNLAIVLHELGKVEDAIKEWRETIKIFPEFWQAHFNIAKALADRGGIEEAVATYLEVIKIGRTSPEIKIEEQFQWLHEEVGNSLLEIGRADEAIAVWKEAAELQPANAGSLRDLAAVLTHCPNPSQRDPAQALELAQKAVKLKDSDEQAWAVLGHARYRAGDWKGAVAALEKSIAFNNRADAVDLLFLAMAHWKLGNPDEARRRYDKAAACSAWNKPVDAGTLERYRTETATLLGIDRFGEAEAAFRQQIVFKLADANLHNSFAWLLATCPDPKRRDAKEAIALAERAVQLRPGNGDYWSTLGTARYRAGDWPGTVKTLNKAMELRKGGDSFDWFFMAMAYRNLGQQEEAQQWFEKAVGWMDKNKPYDEELQRFRVEAAELLDVRSEPMP